MVASANGCTTVVGRSQRRDSVQASGFVVLGGSWAVRLGCVVNF